MWRRADKTRYGYYYAELDGENRRYFNAHSTRDEIPALLFEVSGIPEGDHSLWMMNQQNYDGRRSRSCEFRARVLKEFSSDGRLKAGVSIIWSSQQEGRSSGLLQAP